LKVNHGDNDSDDDSHVRPSNRAHLSSDDDAIGESMGRSNDDINSHDSRAAAAAAAAAASPPPPPAAAAAASTPSWNCATPQLLLSLSHRVHFLRLSPKVEHDTHALLQSCVEKIRNENGDEFDPTFSVVGPRSMLHAGDRSTCHCPAAEYSQSNLEELRQALVSATFDCGRNWEWNPWSDDVTSTYFCGNSNHFLQEGCCQCIITPVFCSSCAALNLHSVCGGVVKSTDARSRKRRRKPILGHHHKDDDELCSKNSEYVELSVDTIDEFVRLWLDQQIE
jgi:hypothetical protein